MHSVCYFYSSGSYLPTVAVYCLFFCTNHPLPGGFIVELLSRNRSLLSDPELHHPFLAWTSLRNGKDNDTTFFLLITRKEGASNHLGIKHEISRNIKLYYSVH